jgi:uncharacterized phiE125 gp8 family phage protein
MALKAVRTVAPSGYPVSLIDVKAQLHVDHSDDDQRIEFLIQAATAHVEKLLGRALVTQTWRQDFSAFADELRLDVGNLIAVTSITYYDADGASQTLGTSVYGAFTDEAGPYIALKPDQSWPATAERDDAVRVTWTAGDGSTQFAVSADDRAAIILLIKDWYDAPETRADSQAAYSIIGSSRRIVV